MFTGLIQDMGTIRAARDVGGPLRLTVAPDGLDVTDLELGESIAHDGICLTVVAVDEGTWDVELGLETLQVTTAADWRPGRRVNLERALALGDRLGGHLVAGHVDGVGRLASRKAEQGVLHLTVEMPEHIAPLVCAKGSICLEGVSLTVNAVTRDTFSVTLIPETLERTTLGELAVGTPVNLEADLIARHLARMVGFDGGGGIDRAMLAKYGYASE